MKLIPKLIAIILVAFVFSTGCKKDNNATNSVTGIKLFSDTASLVIGTSSTFTVTLVPTTATNKAVTWTSSDSSIVKVDANGVVTAVKLGTATLTATSTDGKKSASCVIIVTKEAIYVSDVTLQAPVSVPVGTTSQLNAIVGPTAATNRKVKWVSSNPAVFTVSDAGLLSALTLGTAKVTVTTVDGNFSSSSEITITNGVVAVTGVTLAPTATLALNTTLQLTDTVQPLLAPNRAVTWVSDNTAVVTVDSNGVLTPVSGGTATITVTTAEGNHTASCTVTVEKQNLLVNAGFENGLTSWTKVYGTTTAINTDPTYVHSGTKSLIIPSDPGEGRGQPVSSGFTPGASYTVTAWCKVLGTGAPVQFEIQCYSADSRLKDVGGPDFPATNNWTQESFSTVIPAGTILIQVFIWNNGGKTVYSDDWTFTKD